MPNLITIPPVSKISISISISSSRRFGKKEHKKHELIQPRLDSKLEADVMVPSVVSGLRRALPEAGRSAGVSSATATT